MEDTKVVEQRNDEQEAAPAVESLDPEESAFMQDMMDLGAFYGRSKARTNPKMKSFVLTNRSGFGVIDVRKTYVALKKAINVIEDTVAKQGSILFVGTSPSVKRAVETTAKELELPYVTERWLGGTLTNFDTISKRIKHYKKLKDDKAGGELEKYTKKERLKLERELLKLARLFGGIDNLNKTPALVLITDLKNNEIASREAKQTGITTIGILNTDTDPTLVDYIIPANDRNQKGMEFLIGKIREVILEARKKIPATKIDEEGEKQVEEKKEEDNGRHKEA